jgi:hypothetical protein
MTLADFFDVSPRTIRRWKEAGADLQSARGLLRYLRGIERPAAGVEARLADPSAEADLETLLDGKAPRGTPRPAGTTRAELQAHRTQKLQCQVRLLDIQIGVEKGELLPADWIRENTARVVSGWCAQLDALVGDLPGQIAGLDAPSIRRVLERRLALLKEGCRTDFAKMDAHPPGRRGFGRY